MRVKERTSNRWRLDGTQSLRLIDDKSVYDSLPGTKVLYILGGRVGFCVRAVIVHNLKEKKLTGKSTFGARSA